VSAGVVVVEAAGRAWPSQAGHARPPTPPRSLPRLTLRSEPWPAVTFGELYVVYSTACLRLSVSLALAGPFVWRNNENSTGGRRLRMNGTLSGRTGGYCRVVKEHRQVSTSGVHDFWNDGYGDWRVSRDHSAYNRSEFCARVVRSVHAARVCCSVHASLMLVLPSFVTS